MNDDGAVLVAKKWEDGSRNCVEELQKVANESNKSRRGTARSLDIRVEDSPLPFEERTDAFTRATNLLLAVNKRRLVAEKAAQKTVTDNEAA